MQTYSLQFFTPLLAAK